MEKIKKILSSCDTLPHLSAEKLNAFLNLAEILVEENKKVNVTSITDPVGIALKHFADSLSILEVEEFKRENIKMADIGCGGGFPSIPVKIARDDIDITMIDSTEKKIRYVDSTCKKLGLEGVHPTAARAEEVASKNGIFREKFDVVTARALARLNVLVELCMPFVKVGGTFLSMKASTALEELEEARRAIGQLGGRVKSVKEISFDFSKLDTTDFTPEEKAQIEDFTVAKRYVIIIEKVSHTPDNFPRAYARISKKPL
ncbi:MAG: 16S rRNA (guanine(527)-N(7))-methyltransferase RsmG [Ruminococcaceae bacterium]|nr:16S rRNA (guanine(527)-N(7))-methyltransferase RsmG [Oscillospiraceae bacterium]